MKISLLNRKGIVHCTLLFEHLFGLFLISKTIGLLSGPSFIGEVNGPLWNEYQRVQRQLFVVWIALCTQYKGSMRRLDRLRIS